MTLERIKQIAADYGILLLALVAFSVLKLPHLTYAYYWDESWPYAPAIRQMYTHGVSLMPTAVDPELSRGHPLFFHALGAMWMHVFGGSHTSMHSFALAISLGVLVAVYVAGLKLFNRNVAILALLLTGIQVVFFVQASFVLFEMLIALLAFLSIYQYSVGRYWAAGVCLTALFYTKESGLIAGAVLGVHAVVSCFLPGVSWAERLRRLAAVGVPVALIGVFLLIQHSIRGWWVFPFYSNLVEHSWPAFWYKFRMSCVRLVFYENLKFYTYLVLLAVTVFAAVKSKQYRLLIMLLPAAIIFYYVDDLRAGRILPSIPFFILFMAAVAAFLGLFASRRYFPQPAQRRMVVLCVCFVVAFLCFSTMNFFTYRYLLAALVPMFFVAAVCFDLAIRLTYKALFYPIALVVAGIGLLSFRLNEGYGDADLGAFRGIHVQQQVVDYLEAANAYDSTIATASFLEKQHLTDPATGFLKGTRAFSHIDYDIKPTTRYAVFDNIEPDDRIKAVRQDPGFVLLKRIEDQEVWAEIYVRKQ